jgi:hypothetical protein
MDKQFSEQKEKAPFRSWLLPIAIAVLFFFWGMLIFFMVGDKGPPGWNFGTVEDIPGQSPYSTGRH